MDIPKELQAAVTSAALRLDAAVRAGQPTEALAEEIRAELRATVDVLDAPEVSVTSLDDALARIVGTWEGICEVSVQVDPIADARLAADPVASSTGIDLLTEAVSNSVRHGAASRVDVSLTVAGSDEVRMRVRDDGRPAPPSTRTGLGTSLLEECTLEWSRTIAHGGQVLNVVIPCLPTPDLVPGRSPG